ncbi:HD family phosphohydrolase [Gaoshiqia sediminis]|uniref:HDIG domain-containing protein n=1 Tax=Gaoshiqia sediminis TaxID=2986998 RepID=A0AA41YCP3_9BACT|nr:HDIG domain-containing metalloprotein [Gaoshiqia sediminis]MCW0484133.1 HDIG domain-containing protein [Gaoshiqia sediminis]
MKKLLTRLAQYYHFFYIAFAFSAAIFLLYLIIPGESRFRYEFQKNAPWRHETLIAPYNFAIYKPDEVIKSEQDSVKKQFIPYYTKDTLVSLLQSRNFELELQGISGELPALKPETIQQLTSHLTKIYQAGVIAQSPEAHPVLKDKSELFEVSDKMARKIPVSSVYSMKTAFQSLSDSARTLLKDQYENLNQSTNLADYIQANLNYNEEFNALELEKLINSVSLTQGMVQAGERIIFKGDIVTPDKFLILESLKKSYSIKQGYNMDRYLLILGKLILIIACLLILILYLAYFRPEIFREKRHLSFILLLIILMVFSTRFVSQHDFINIYVVPLAILPILLRIFFDSRTAIYALLVTSLLIGYFAPNNYEFIFMNIIAGIIAVFSLDKLHRRSHLVFTALWVLISYSVVYLALSMIQEGNMEAIRWEELEWFAANAVLVLLAYPLIYIFEKMFGFVSDVTLIELSNTNQPLLRKLAEEAPGTFQHSLQIANLAEAVIHRIGGNPFLAYAGALYHDIGKTNQPAYFIENQSAGMNPHSELDYKDSARVIIDHVTYGVRLARKHKLPEVLIDFISSHHGTTQAKYFYTLYKNENPDMAIDPKEFSYPGPRPKSKETSVVMLIDGIEAATRALKEKTPDNLKTVIENMVQQKVDDGQLDNADLTLRDIRIVKETLTEKLMNIYHIRIEYPKENT